MAQQLVEVEEEGKREEAEEADRRFHRYIAAHRFLLRHAEALDRVAAEGEPEEEGGDDGCHGSTGGAEAEAKEADPGDLVDQARTTGENENQQQDGIHGVHR